MFEVKAKEKTVTVLVPDQLVVMKDQLLKSFEEMISDIKDYKVTIDVMKKK